jgi:NAD(P)-dependent dehydrogenase (short-subunit alcohol dehydrogenase family)
VVSSGLTYLKSFFSHLLVALSDILSQELRPQGIRVLNVAPGGLRTKSIHNSRVIGNTTLAFPAPDVELGEVPEYAQIRVETREFLGRINGAETGDAKKAANVIVDIVRGEGIAEGRPSTETLFLGSDAIRDVGAKCQATLKTIEEWGDVARSIDIDQ